MEHFELYKNNNLLEKKHSWYMIKGEDDKMHRLPLDPEKANEKLQSLIQEGKIKDITLLNSPSGSEAKEPKKDEVQQVEKSLEPENPPKDPEPKQTSKEPDPEKLADELMASKLGDIRKRGKHGRFNVFIHGVDSRKEGHPTVKAHKFVYRHCAQDKNVRSADNVINDGWSVFTKKMNPVDPRTGKRRITVARDDTPEGDFYTVGKQVLCYASKEQFEEKKGLQVLENALMIGKTLDNRQKKSRNSALASKQKGVEVSESLKVYGSDYEQGKQVSAETFENSGMTKAEAKNAVNQIEQKLSITEQIDQAKKGLTQFDTIKAVNQVSIDSI